MIKVRIIKFLLCYVLLINIITESSSFVSDILTNVYNYYKQFMKSVGTSLHELTKPIHKELNVCTHTHTHTHIHMYVCMYVRTLLICLYRNTYLLWNGMIEIIGQ